MEPLPPSYQVPPAVPPAFPLQPLGFGEILSESWRLYRRYAGVFFGIILIMSLPSLVLSTVLAGSDVQRAFLSDMERLSRIVQENQGNPDQSRLQQELRSLNFDAILRFTMMALGIWLVDFFLFRSLAIGAITVAVGEAYAGRRPTLASSFGAFRRMGVLLGWGLVLGLITLMLLGTPLLLGLGLAGQQSQSAVLLLCCLVPLACLLVPGFLLTRLLFGSRAIVAENLGIGEAWQRSWQLTRRYFWRILGIALGLLLFVGIIQSLINMAVGVLVGGGMGTTSALLANLLSVVASSAIAPLVYIGLTLLYYDQRRLFEYRPPAPYPGGPYPGGPYPGGPSDQ